MSKLGFGVNQSGCSGIACSVSSEIVLDCGLPKIILLRKEGTLASASGIPGIGGKGKDVGSKVLSKLSGLVHLRSKVKWLCL